MVPGATRAPARNARFPESAYTSGYTAPLHVTTAYVPKRVSR